MTGVCLSVSDASALLILLQLSLQLLCVIREFVCKCASAEEATCGDRSERVAG